MPDRAAPADGARDSGASFGSTSPGRRSRHGSSGQRAPIDAALGAHFLAFDYQAVRIAFDVSPLSHERTGVNNYIRGSLQGLAEAAARAGDEVVAFAPTSPEGSA